MLVDWLVAEDLDPPPIHWAPEAQADRQMACGLVPLECWRRLEEHP